MVRKITKGIGVLVKTMYEGILLRNLNTYHNFSYYITIENKSADTVQLINRYWEIFDSLNVTEIVKGEGVVGQTPILKPQDVYTYKSGCILHSDIGTTKGFFTMTDIDSLETFAVTIPSSQLITPSALN
ncbi:MAG: Co2+/Mg2+ efflux protein ApaG [Flavobacteriaceae bacterium]|nr:MAG: Co2+/Mg2+ efflux protein ApaG [Flavobacteriaceae bacterium]